MALKAVPRSPIGKRRCYATRHTEVGATHRYEESVANQSVESCHGQGRMLTGPATPPLSVCRRRRTKQAPEARRRRRCRRRENRRRAPPCCEGARVPPRAVSSASSPAREPMPGRAAREAAKAAAPTRSAARPPIRRVRRPSMLRPRPRAPAPPAGHRSARPHAERASWPKVSKSRTCRNRLWRRSCAPAATPALEATGARWCRVAAPVPTSSHSALACGETVAGIALRKGRFGRWAAAGGGHGCRAAAASAATQPVSRTAPPLLGSGDVVGPPACEPWRLRCSQRAGQ